MKKTIEDNKGKDLGSGLKGEGTGFIERIWKIQYLKKPEKLGPFLDLFP